MQPSPPNKLKYCQTEQNESEESSGIRWERAGGWQSSLGVFQTDSSFMSWWTHNTHHTTSFMMTPEESSLVHTTQSIRLSAAFKTVDHNILLERLECAVGVKGNKILQWFASYLKNKTFTVNRVTFHHLLHLFCVMYPRDPFLDLYCFLFRCFPWPSLFRNTTFHITVMQTIPNPKFFQWGLTTLFQMMCWNV